MIRPLALTIVITLLGTTVLQAVDFTLVNALPKRIAAAHAKSQKGWDTGVTATMRKASTDYINAMKAMMVELGATYYPEGEMTAEKVEEYVTSLLAVARFEKGAENVTGDPPGTIVVIEIQGQVIGDLQEMIAAMVETIAGQDDKFDFEAWQKKWEKAVEDQ